MLAVTKLNYKNRRIGIYPYKNMSQLVRTSLSDYNPWEALGMFSRKSAEGHLKFSGNMKKFKNLNNVFFLNFIPNVQQSFAGFFS